MENKITEDFYEKVKEHLKKYSDEEIIKWRNELINANKMDNKLLSLFNEEMLDRSCKEKSIKK